MKQQFIDKDKRMDECGMNNGKDVDDWDKKIITRGCAIRGNKYNLHSYSTYSQTKDGWLTHHLNYLQIYNRNIDIESDNTQFIENNLINKIINYSCYF